MRIRIKADWWFGGKMGTQLGKPVMVGQLWTPVLWDDEEDPTFFKTAGLERATRKSRSRKPKADRCANCGDTAEDHIAAHCRLFGKSKKPRRR